MKKLLVLNNCTECCHYEHDNNEDPEWWGKTRCKKLNKELLPTYVYFENVEYDIPDWCPLEDAPVEKFSNKEKSLLKDGLSTILDRYEGTNAYSQNELNKVRKLLEKLKHNE